ncbi:MAG: hypothetical protein ACI843_001369 [Psychrobacter glaciei]|jgi:hypothetical protein
MIKITPEYDNHVAKQQIVPSNSLQVVAVPFIKASYSFKYV